MLLKQQNLYHIPIAELLDTVKEFFPNYSYDVKKHILVLENENYENVGNIRLPLHFSLNQELEIVEEETTVLYLSIESGNAAICLMEGKENIYHTTFSAYMTRKKQGFSQIKYLNKKGKSRAGSRVRLASTVQFFENINTVLQGIFEEYLIDRVGLSCSPTLIPYLHDSAVSCPFEKKDDRLYKIPLDIPQSNFTNLFGAIKKLMAPIIFYNENNKELIKDFLNEY